MQISLAEETTCSRLCLASKCDAAPRFACCMKLSGDAACVLSFPPAGHLQSP